MTKTRDPVSIENTLREVIGLLKIGRAAEATGRQPAYLHAMTDPAKPGELTVKDVVALDLEWRASGREGYPLLATIERMIRTGAEDRFAEEHAFGSLTFEFVKESGEASAALVAAMAPGAPVQVLETALREAEHADNAVAPVIANLKRRIGRARDGPRAPPDG